MNVALWTIAGVLAAVLMVSSCIKLLVPRDTLARLPRNLGPAAQATGEWTRDFSPSALKALGPPSSVNIAPIALGFRVTAPAS
jgi:hypothetical protein